MKIISFLILLLISTSSWGFNHDVVKGQWAVYQNGMYYFISINKDFSGVLVRSLEHEPITREFKSSNVIKRDGYIEINLPNNEKAVLSAWKLPTGEGRLTGQIFMYKESGELFNMLYFPLSNLEKHNELMNQNEIKELHEKYR